MSKFDTAVWATYGILVGGYATLVGVRVFTWILDWLDTNQSAPDA